MYLEFFDLTRPPFGIAPDPDFLYLSPQHQEGLEHLRYGIDQRKGFIVLTGEVGCGKTTLCEALFRDLPEESYCNILIPNPNVDEVELFRAILKGMGQSSTSHSPLELMETIRLALKDCGDHGKEVVLTIDEAQGLSVNMLEQIRLLSNLETNDHKVLQIILAGQPELRKRLRQKELRQLRQRILVYYDLHALKFFETIRYVNYRLAFAGGNGKVKFSFLALIALHRASKGIPRLINSLCDRALLAAFIRGAKTVGRKDMKRAIRDFRRL